MAQVDETGRRAAGIMRPPSALALAALCLLALPAAAAAAYFGLVPAAPLPTPPTHLPTPPPATRGQLFRSSALAPRISNSDLSSSRLQPHLAVGVRTASSVAGFPG